MNIAKQNLTQSIGEDKREELEVDNYTDIVVFCDDIQIHKTIGGWNDVNNTNTYIKFKWKSL